MNELPEGMAYRVLHRRAGSKVDGGNRLIPSPKGGKTIVQVGFPKYEDGKFVSFQIMAEAEARCNSKLDFYNKKRGRDIALGRALRKLNEPEAQHSKGV